MGLARRAGRRPAADTAAAPPGRRCRRRRGYSPAGRTSSRSRTRRTSGGTMTITIEQLSAYYDRELAPDEHQVVEAHLPQCADCETALRQWDALSRAVATAAPSRTSPRRVPVLIVAGVLALLAVGSTAAV